jgi:hypothetical protein
MPLVRESRKPSQLPSTHVNCSGDGLSQNRARSALSGRVDELAVKRRPGPQSATFHRHSTDPNELIAKLINDVTWICISTLTAPKLKALQTTCPKLTWWTIECQCWPVGLCWWKRYWRIQHQLSQKRADAVSKNSRCRCYPSSLNAQAMVKQHVDKTTPELTTAKVSLL